MNEEQATKLIWALRNIEFDLGMTFFAVVFLGIVLAVRSFKR